MKGIGADSTINGAALKWELLSVGLVKIYIPKAARLDPGHFNLVGGNIDAIELALALYKAGHIAYRPTRTATNVEKMEAGS
jgi:hypothetical protein